MGIIRLNLLSIFPCREKELDHNEMDRVYNIHAMKCLPMIISFAHSLFFLQIVLPTFYTHGPTTLSVRINNLTETLSLVCKLFALFRLPK